MTLPQLDRTMEAAPPVPQRRWRRLALLVPVLVAALVIAVVGYGAVRNAGNPAAVALDSTAAVPGAQAVPPAGTWQVTPGPDGFVGYRVSEPPNVTVVGRSSAVTGTLTLATEGDQVRLVTGEIRADLRELRSDAQGRDEALRVRILETDRFPQAVFTLDSPVSIGTRHGR